MKYITAIIENGDDLVYTDFDIFIHSSSYDIPPNIIKGQTYRVVSVFPDGATVTISHDDLTPWNYRFFMESLKDYFGITNIRQLRNTEVNKRITIL
jgi:hypothetical protein